MAKKKITLQSIQSDAKKDLLAAKENYKSGNNGSARGFKKTRQYKKIVGIKKQRSTVYVKKELKSMERPELPPDTGDLFDYKANKRYLKKLEKYERRKYYLETRGRGKYSDTEMPEYYESLRDELEEVRKEESIPVLPEYPKDAETLTEVKRYYGKLLRYEKSVYQGEKWESSKTKKRIERNAVSAYNRWRNKRTIAATELSEGEIQSATNLELANIIDLEGISKVYKISYTADLDQDFDKIIIKDYISDNQFQFYWLVLPYGSGVDYVVSLALDLAEQKGFDVPLVIKSISGIKVYRDKIKMDDALEDLYFEAEALKDSKNYMMIKTDIITTPIEVIVRITVR